MIGLMIFGFILVCAFYAWFPDYVRLIEPVFWAIAVLWLVIKILISILHSRVRKSSIEDTWDEFDFWQDDQGL